MARVAILGAGPLGGALAYRLALADCASEVRLIDRAAAVAEGKALDIQQAGPLAGFATRLVGQADPDAAVGAAVIVVADEVDPARGEIDGDEALLVLQRLHTAAPETIVLCAGARHRSFVERAVRERGLPRSKVMGSAPLALQGAVRALVAAMIDASPAEVVLSVLGAPPDRTVVAWSSATFAGSPLSERLDPPQQRRIEAALPHLWPPGPVALASAAARATEAILAVSRRLVPCFVVVDDFGDARDRAVALPARLGPAGVERIVRPALSRQEAVRLGNALAGPS